MQNKDLDNKDLDIRELINLLWLSKIKIAIFAIVFFVFSFVYSNTLVDQYKSEALLMVSEQSSNTPQLPSSYSSLASMAGISIPQSSAENKINLGLEVMLSREFLYSFIKERNLIVSIMAAKEWDPISNKLLIDQDIYDTKKQLWVSDDFSKEGPSIHETYEEFLKYVAIEKDKLTGFITISITSPSPINSRDWVNYLIEDINRVIKEKDLNDSNKALIYLNEQVAKTSLTELREVFFTIIESELRTKMLASISDEYLFSFIDRPIVAEEKEAPNRFFISIVGLILGLIFGVTIVLFSAFLKEEKI